MSFARKETKKLFYQIGEVASELNVNVSLIRFWEKEFDIIKPKKNKKGNFIHFKIEGNGKTISELEKNEKIDKNLLRYLTIRVKKIDLKTNYFEKKEEKDNNLKTENSENKNEK